MLLPILCGAQSPPVKVLSIGDTVPDITITNVYNYPASTIHLSDLKGKLVILDFWATWCGSCIREFPKMHELQKQFNGRVQILMVDSDTSESENHVSNFLERRKERTGEVFTLPYILHNYQAARYFPHSEIPHYVWINSFGKVVGITTAEDVTSQNIELFLKNTSYTLFTKKDYLRFNPDKPLLIDENGGDDPGSFLYRSIITGFKENLGAQIGTRVVADGDVTRLYALNCSLLALLRIAYHSVFKAYETNRIIVESKKYSKAYFTDNARSMLPENRYCYEIITAPAPRAEVIKYMQQDIYRNFKISAKNETREMDCYVLQANQRAAKIKTKGGERHVDVQESTLHKYLRNEPFSVLINQVIQPHFSIPVIDETNLSYNIDLSFPSDFSGYGPDQIIKYLHANGLDLTRTKRKLEAVVISGQAN